MSPSLIQDLGWASSALIVLAFLMEDDRKLLWTLTAGTLVLAGSLWLKGAATIFWAAALVSAARFAAAAVWRHSLPLLATFAILTLASGIMTWSGLPSFLALAALLVTMIATFMLDGAQMRLGLLAASAFWIVHHLVTHETASLATEGLVVAANLVTLGRLLHRARGPKKAAT